MSSKDSEDGEVLNNVIDLEFLEKARVDGFRLLKFPQVLEQAFLEDYFKHSLRTLRTGLLVGTAFWFLFVFDDLSMPDPNWKYAVAIRFGIVTPIILLFLAFTYSKHFKGVYQLVMSIVAFIVGIGMLAIIHQHEKSIIFHHHSSLLLLIIVSYTLFRLRFYYAVGSMFSLSLVDIAVTINYTEVSSDLISVEVLRILAINGIGMTANYILEFYTRNEFLKSSLLDRRRLQAEEATALKDKFVSLVSHDLKSPISTSIGLLRMLKKSEGDTFNAKQADIIDRVLKGSEKMVDTIESLLNVSRLQTGKLVPKKSWVNLHLVVDDIFEKLNFLAEQKGVSLNNEMPLQRHMFLDKDLIHEVFLNLISNAIKFCKAGDKIAVFVPFGKNFSITVKDSGVGIDPKIVPDLFKHEVKTTAVGTGGEKGTGLGLPFCNDIMKVHGGIINVVSHIGEGTEFNLLFPDTGFNVLVVYREQANRGMAREYLQKAGPIITEARSYADALKWIEGGNFNMIIIDCELEAEELSQFLGKVREKGFGNISFQGICNSAGENSRMLSLFGITDMLIKPLDAMELMSRIKKVAH